MTPEEDFLGPNAPSCQDFQSLWPPLSREFPACHPSGGGGGGGWIFSGITQLLMVKRATFDGQLDDVFSSCVHA